ncbi:hypothetical protein ACGF3G_35105 [Streptomyces sp. NPDC048179]|uniref:hypothetical protein n=1 Tax=Streptomyces sp. NPDC048179 TaxID=3365506 RepID=UPI00371261D1
MILTDPQHRLLAYSSRQEAADDPNRWLIVHRRLPDVTVDVVADVAGMYRAYDQVRELERQPGTRVLAGHDPEVMTRFTPHLPGQVCRVL